MAAGRGGIAGGAPILLFGVVPVMAYQFMRNALPGWVVCGVAAIQIAAIVWMLTGSWAVRYRAPLIAVTFAAGMVLLDRLPIGIAGLVAAGGCHAFAYTSLLIWFGTSLRSNREPLVTSFARRIGQTMPEKVVRYTRQVTIAWCLFFAAQLAVSAALVLLAPASVWSAFVTLLNLPLIAAMVLGEFGVRVVLFRNEPHSSLLRTVSAWRQACAEPVGRP
jgi:uncharacterized membrane protein